MPSVSVIIVTWNCEKVIGPCLGALASDPEVLEVVVVDNASRDATTEIVERDFPHVRVIRNAGNDGFGRACNQAARTCQGEYLFLLNPDTIVTPDLVSRLARALTLDRSLALVGPVVTDPNGQVRLAGQRFLTLGGILWSRVIPIRRIVPVRVPRGTAIVDWVTGAAMMARREVYLSAGGFNEVFWMYNEDMELCWRLGKAGWRVAVIPEARVAHLHSESTKRNLESAHLSDAHGVRVWLDLTGRRSIWPLARCVLAVAALVQGCRAVLGRPRRFSDAKTYLRISARILNLRGYQLQ
jgi:GT2 family glycosyltransferase